MTEQVVAATRGRTVIAARCGDHALTPPVQGPGRAGAVRAGASRQSTGRCGEDLAATYLEDIGWQVLERNWRPEHGLRGELDIIALEPAPGGREPGDESIGSEQMTRTSVRPTLVVVEVKTPSKVDDAQRALLQQLAKLRGEELPAARVVQHSSSFFSKLRERIRS